MHFQFLHSQRINYKQKSSWIPVIKGIFIPCFHSLRKNQPLCLWKPPFASKLTNICHQFTRIRLSRIPLLTRAAACRVSSGCTAFTTNQGWRMSRRSEPFQTGLTWKITWLQLACNFQWLWPLIISWSTSFIPASVGGPMLIWDLVCLKVSTWSLSRVWCRFILWRRVKAPRTTRRKQTLT